MEERAYKFIDTINKVFIGEIYNYKDYWNKDGEKELFEDFIETYKRAYKMLLNNKLVDGLVIARSSYETLLTLIGIRIDKDCREEYFRANRYERYKERQKQDPKAKDYMSVSYLRSRLKKSCKTIAKEIDIMYEFLSMYAHTTIYRSYLRNVEKQKINISKIYFNIISAIPFIALTAIYDLKVISKEKFLDLLNLKQWLEITINFCEKKNLSKQNLQGLNKFLYIETNKDFYKIKELENKNEGQKIIKDFTKNQKWIEKLYSQTANKFEYNWLYKEMVEIISKIGGN